MGCQQQYLIEKTQQTVDSNTKQTVDSNTKQKKSETKIIYA